jgi:thioredoxin reductase
VTVPHDAVVVGGGPAGLAAATWLARYRRDVVVVDAEQLRAEQVEQSHGYLGRDPQVPRELVATAREQLLRYPTASYVRARVTAVDGEYGDFRLALDDGSELRTLRVVLATGVSDRFPAIEGFATHYGADAFHCPACDGYDAEDRDVVAYGWNERLVGFATTLLNWARSVTVVTGGRRFEGDDACCTTLDSHGIPIVEEEAAALVGERGALRAVRLASGRELPASLLFFSVAHDPRVELARALGCAVDDEGYVEVDREGRTSVRGVYAAGDVVPGLQLVQVAAAQGCIAGVGAAVSLQGEPGSPLSPPPAPDAPGEVEARRDAADG